ncbi:MAG: alpha-mannosidase [Nitrospiraceae bacterium]|nr:alpha-mannosidase [Nitrospiraceae bacterium]
MHPPKVVEKLRKRIARLGQWRYGKLQDVALDYAETEEHFRKPPAELQYRPAPLGTRWGAEWMTAWFRGKITLPQGCQGRRVYYRHLSFSEKLLFVDTIPFAGMNPHHQEVLLTLQAKAGQEFDIAVEAYSGHRMSSMDPCDPGMFFHQVCGMDPGETPPHTLEASELLIEREETNALFHDATVLLQTALSLGEESLRRATILDQLNQAIDHVPLVWEDDEELESAAQSAREILAPLLARKNSPTTPHVGLAGYGHIDLAWLWPLRETIRKVARTFTTHLALMEEYPELCCIQSQPILIEMLAEHYPELLPRVEAAVAKGRWEPNGGMWVEADTNIPGGESLIRQFVEGNKATAERFGYQSDILWLPDVFGYSAALPQILRQCGIEGFVTSKINWNDTTRFPFDTFFWQGVDGTEVFTHFITARLLGYNAEVSPESSWDCWRHVQQKEVQDSVLCPIGYGDGGGGVTRDMCERAQRMGDIEGCPKTSFVNVSEFVKRLRDQQVKRPRWIGELYLELHRGTYTIQAWIKRWNRKLEFLLRDVELFSVMATPLGLAYPARELQEHWRTLLTNHCHDNIAGSTIRQSCEEIVAEYVDLNQALTALKMQALRALSGGLDARQNGTPMLVANSLSWDRESLVFAEGAGFTSARDADGTPLPCQTCTVDGKPGLAVKAPIGGMSVTSIFLEAKGNETDSPFVNGAESLETPYYKVRFDSAGKIARLVDKDADREIVQPGRRINDFYSAQNVPIYWDAFDIEAYYRDMIESEDGLLAKEVVEDGPLFITYRLRYAIGRHSTLTQDLTFYAHSRRIDFKTEVDWHERRRMLKVGFPVDIHSDTWRNEIQFGHIVRNRHSNTPHDQAQFEVCAHKWVDVSEGGYGVALLNDCKYGHDSLDNMISLTLLRSPGGPSDSWEEGHHVFTYALLPHRGGFSVESVVREAYMLNVPLCGHRMDQFGSGGRAITFVRCSNPNVIVETVKKAEESDAVVVRVYEAARSRGPATLTFAAPVEHASECNCLERDDKPVRIEGNTIAFEIKPFQIMTFKVSLTNA